jgi:hypothetical protein
MDDCAWQQKFNLKSDDNAVTGEPKRIIFFWEPNEKPVDGFSSGRSHGR